MDTRNKILPSWEGLAALEPAGTIVCGHFDPLLAAHAERLRAVASEGRPVAVIVTEPENPLLPAGARAELVAGLASVDYVIVAPAAPPAPAGWRMLREEAADRERTAELIRRVHGRQSAG